MDRKMNRFGGNARIVLIGLAALPVLLSAGSSARAEQAATAQVGQKAPAFTLTDLDGKEHSLAGYLAEGKVVVLEWFNPDCPFVKKHHQAHTTMIDLEQKYRSKGVVWLAVNSGAPGMQGNGLERNRAAKKEYKMEYPILLDESGRVGRLYGAKTTPHMFVIKPDGVLAYKGAIDDDKSPGKLGGTNYVRGVLEAVTSDKTPSPTETQSYGCSVKYAAS